MANPLLPLAALGAGLLLATKGRERLRLSAAKHKSLGGHVRLAKRIAGQVPFYEYGKDRFFRADGAPPEIAAARHRGFDRLAVTWAERFPNTLALTRETRSGLSDLQFTAAYRVPFQFSRRVREQLGTGAFYERAEGPLLYDLDGNRFIDLTGSYGVNLFGTEFYKQTIREGAAAVEALGPVLAGLHPLVADNVRRLRDLSGLDEVSFHMSGTEAVMQAVRLARYHTGRKRLVRFAGAYHGWWGDVQPGIGNPVPEGGTLTLAEMSDKTLDVLRRRQDIACVLVNPLQSLHPNGAAPSDGQLVDGTRRAAGEREAYIAWLHRLAEVCRGNGIVLILDEVFVGFRLAPGSVARAWGIQPDMITFGKTLGGGLPVGVLTGRAELMKRWRDDRPVDICFARGTFNSHPYVMGAMDAFLRRLETPKIQKMYDGIDERWDANATALNAALAADALPVRVANLQTIWTVLYDAPSAYNWMLQYYLREAGLALSWVGTGRLIFSLDIDDAVFAEATERFVGAVRQMRDDGWFWHQEGATNKDVRRRILRETLAVRLGREEPELE